jgi:hypothetical protein
MSRGLETWRTAMADVLALIYSRIEERLTELEKRAGELEHKLAALEELARQVDALEQASTAVQLALAGRR